MALAALPRALGRQQSPRFRFRPGRNSRAWLSSRTIATLPVDTVSIDNDDDRLQERLASILEPYHHRQEPVVVRGAANGAPATALWSSWDYWERRLADFEGGVSVEMGGSYGSESATRAELPFETYLQFLRLFEERHGREGPTSGNNGNIPPDEELVYMAQNDLPAPLYDDVMIPDFCQNGDPHDGAPSSPVVGHGRLYSVMLWLGPRGCVSPLHQDPLDNLLFQHLGRKRILLFAPDTGSEWQYAGHDGQQSNTSPIDPEVVDALGVGVDATNGKENETTNNLSLAEHQQKYPRFFEEAPPRWECLLEPGDFLYIPSRWWHHVRSIDTSASVNVWWR